MAEYPSWVYDVTGMNGPIYVASDDQYVALMSAPVSDPTQIATSPTAPLRSHPTLLPTPATALNKVGGVTQDVSLSIARWNKNPALRRR